MRILPLREAAMNYRHFETYVELYTRDREAALERAFNESIRRHDLYPPGVFTWSSAYGSRLPLMRYGRYKVITREELAGRRFEIQLTDYRPSILWLDVVHDARTHKMVSSSNAEYDFDSLILPNSVVSSFGQA